MNSAQPSILDATVQNGGASFEAGTLAPFEPEDGYAVGIGGIEMDLDMFRALGEDGREELLRRIAAEYGASHVGTWLPASGNVVYIDAVQYFSPLAGQAAWQMAVRTNQQEVFDFGAGRSIRPGQISFDQ